MSTELNDAIVAANSEALMACYLSGEVRGPQRCRYFYSKLIRSTSWNRAILARPWVSSECSFVVESARSNDRCAAFFIREADIKNLDLQSGDLSLERWMMLPGTKSLVTDVSDSELRFASSSRPGADFETVLTDLFEDDSVNRRFRTDYFPAMLSAPEVPGVRSLHVVGYHKDVPVCCGTLLISAGFAGLYNIGTRSSWQKRGFGRRMTEELVRLSRSVNDGSIYLQCVVDTHVERMYLDLGFVIVETPGIYTIK